MLHVSFVPSQDDPFPTILPMLGAVGSFSTPDTPLDAGPLDLYLHGSSTARLMRITDPAKLGSDEGVPLCVAATHIDGIVLALSSFHSSANYRSAVAHGWGTLVTDPEERLYAMGLITNSIIPGRWEGSRLPPLQSELTSTGILKVRIVSASAKVRTGATAEEKKDLENEEVMNSVYSGIVPMWVQRGEPIPTEHNRLQVPGYLREWIDGENERGRKYAEAAVGEELLKKSGRHESAHTGWTSFLRRWY